ncbi:GDSL esterase/lipase 7-like [Arachis ipaensis]|uniref:GDSL esterase/lipase 7-like n=1 Tax=Arachis ipaensis TaxID=130454 RepID=UPI000A2B3DFC|nr:GDSL esterase/lipase 7-like [Arachis ipaensis]
MAKLIITILEIYNYPPSKENLFERTVETNLAEKLKNRKEVYDHLSKSIYLVAVGSNDYINNYLATKYYDTSKLYQPRIFAQLLIHKLSEQFQRLYKLGARKIVMFGIGPIGCTPPISKTQLHKGDCLEETNQIVSYFNQRLPSLLSNLTFTLPHSSFVLGHAYSILDAFTNPSTYGLTDAKSPCCNAWENGTAACIPLTKPCMNPFEHFFWDGYHLTEAMYSYIASACLNGNKVCTPLNIQELVKL